jgi:hypothetical protein
MIRRKEYLESLRAKGTFLQCYDPEGERHSMATFPFHYAAKGLLTRRQLRAQDLAPGGQEPCAQILWKHNGKQRVAYLYDEAKAVPKRVPTPAQLEAIAKALAARKTCQSCGETKDYCIPTSLGECSDCHEGAKRQAEKDTEIEAA